MAFNLPESESQTPDGVPLGWEAPWEKPQMMVVEEREGMRWPEHARASLIAQGLRLVHPVCDMSNLRREISDTSPVTSKSQVFLGGDECEGGCSPVSIRS